MKMLFATETVIFIKKTAACLSSIQYSNGLLHRLLIAFYDNGFTKRKVYYELGHKNGLEQLFYIKGQLQSSLGFSNGKPIGVFKYFAENGVENKTQKTDGC